MRLAITALLALLLLALGSCGGGGGGTDPITAMLAQLNVARVAAGQPPLTVNALLSQVAQAQATYNRAQGANLTANADGDSLIQQSTDAGYTGAGFIILTGNGNQNGIGANWLADADVTTALADPAYTDLGLGVAGSGNAQFWVGLLADPQ